MNIDVLGKFISAATPLSREFELVMLNGFKVSYRTTLRKLNALKKRVWTEETDDIARAEMLSAIASGVLFAALRAKQPLEKCLKLFGEFERSCMGTVYGPCMMALVIAVYAGNRKNSALRDTILRVSNEAKKMSDVYRYYHRKLQKAAAGM